MLLLLYRPLKAVGTFRASPIYEQSCYIVFENDIIFLIEAGKLSLHEHPCASKADYS